jgi:hypothetical protein
MSRVSGNAGYGLQSADAHNPTIGPGHKIMEDLATNSDPSSSLGNQNREFVGGPTRADWLLYRGQVVSSSDCLG